VALPLHDELPVALLLHVRHKTHPAMPT